MKDILLIGFGGHAKSVIDSIESIGEYHIIGFLETPQRQDILYKSYQVIGIDDDLQKFYDDGIRHAFITIGYMGQSSLRLKLFEKLTKIGYAVPAIIDKSAIVAADVHFSEGCYVGKGTVINANSFIGKMCIINSGSLIEHDCSIGNFTHVSVGAVLCGGVSVLNHSFIGANATILQGISIGSHSIVGAGSIITKAVEGNCVIHNKISMSCQLRKEQ